MRPANTDATPIRAAKTLMAKREMKALLHDSDRLDAEFKFEELFRIREKANVVETKIERQRYALEEKSAALLPVINFLRTIRTSISAIYERDKD